MNLILFGAPGAGKGTQSGFLIKRNGMLQISTGDLLRTAIKNQTKLGLDAKSYISEGRLVPDELVINLVRETLVNIESNFILDGFPRTVVQAEALQKLLDELQLKVKAAIFLEVPYNVLLGRLSGRRVCRSCASVYHVESKPTLAAGVCDQCGGEVVQREDDKESVIANRLKTYEEFTLPLKNYFKQTGQYAEVDGSQEEETVYKSIKNLMNL
ncbi:MAG: adenylate kinase [Bdellovibrionales bacterium]